jgi:hypothetical protein
MTPTAFNIDAAQEFLSILDPNTGRFTFQTFDDSKGKRRELVRVYHGELGSFTDELRRLNTGGAGIFVTVQRTNLRGRKIGDIEAVRAVFGDFDEGLPQEFSLEPSILVQSSPGKYQAYWLTDELSREDFKAVEDHIVAAYGADKNATDLARVLRVPGSFHNKVSPFPVTIVGGNRQRYTRDEILTAFPALSPVSPKTAGAEKKQSGGRIEEALEFIPADDYGVWRRIGCALHHQFDGSEDGLAIWNDWAVKSAKYDAAESRRQWNGFGQQAGAPITVASLFHLARQHEWKGRVDAFDWPELNNKGEPIRRSQANIRAVLNHLAVSLSFDEFSGKYEVRFGNQKSKELTDSITRGLYLKADELGLKSAKDYFHDVVRNIAQEHTYHPVKDYLNSLKWDGTPRVDTWLIKYGGADDTPYTRAVSRIFVAAAVRRVRSPGVKFDNLVTLEGPQNAGKSSLARILAGDDWFTDCVHLGDEPKIVAEQTAGKWIIEVAELSGISKKEVEAVKASLSRQVDRARLAYERSTSSCPRQFVLIGTTNSDRYLRDPTGNRRFWPVKIGKIDLAALARDRDQIWAEAAQLEAEGLSLELPPELRGAAEREQEARRDTDPLETRLAGLVENIWGIIPVEELFAAIGLGRGRVASRNAKHQDIVRRVMERARWDKTRRRYPGVRNSTGDPVKNSENRKDVYSREDTRTPLVWWKFFEDEDSFVADPSCR